MKKFIVWLFWPKVKLTKLSEIEHIAIILINLLPIIGVLFYQWEVFPILLLYCIESAIGIIFEFFRRKPSKTTPGMPAFIEDAFFIIILILAMILPLTIIFLTSERERTWQSIRDTFFFISLLIFVCNQLIFQIRHFKRIKTHKLDSKKLGSDAISIKPLLLVILAVLIALTGTHKIAMIALIIIKIFWEMRSYLRKKMVSVQQPS